MTIEGLAAMIAKGFDNTASKEDIGRVDNRLNGLEKKVDKIDFRVDELHDILARFEEGDILDLQKRIKILERIVRSISSKL